MKSNFVWLLLCVLALTGCSSRRTAAPVQHVERINHTVPVSRDQTQRIVREARKWIGTPYRYGGQTRAGTDCSGLTMVLFEDVYGIKLPRSSAMQREYALPIGEREMQPGDLVFFCTAGGPQVSHVGLYIGSGRMIHASTSRGVIESALDEKYYKQRFHSAGRVVTPTSTPEAAAAVTADRKKLRKTIKELEREKKRLMQLEKEIDSKIEIKIDTTSVYVTEPDIFD